MMDKEKQRIEVAEAAIRKAWLYLRVKKKKISMVEKKSRVWK